MSTRTYRDIVDAAEQLGLNPKYVAVTRGGEYHGPCPACGGKDRFILNPNHEATNCKGTYYCRQCEIKGDFIEFCRTYCGCETFEDAVACANGTMPLNFTKSSSTKRSRTQPLPIQIIKPQPIRTITPVSSVWQEQATLLVAEAHDNLLKNTDMLQWLAQRGLPYEAVVRYKIGWVSEPRRYAGSAWGISYEELFIPAGLIIPTFGKDVKPRRLKVRCKDWHPQSTYAKYIAISGSMEGLNLIGDTRNKKVAIVESELDAYAIHYAVGDLFCVIAIGGNNKKPDTACAYIAQTAEQLFICHDNDAAGTIMLKRWREVNRVAIAYPTPIGKDIGEAITLGLNIRNFFLTPITPKAVEVILPEQPEVVSLTETILSIAPLLTEEISAAQQEQIPPNEQVNVPIEKTIQVEQFVATPLNDSKMLIEWAKKYFNSIPDTCMLPSDRRLRREMNALTEAIELPTDLHKELLQAYRVVTNQILF